MTNNIKFSVIIPTRERADTLLHCLRTVVAQDYENLCIIVSDNFSQDNTREIVDSFKDPRIKYINPGKRLSMSHHWEFALSHVTDGWVTIVGDDDGLLPGALATVAEAIQKTGCQAITSKLCYYIWPNSAAIENNHLIVPLTSGIEIRNGREWLSRLMRGDAVYPDLPYLYTGGFVDVLAINRARGTRGTFFLSLAPDFYSAIALASVLDNYVVLNEPIAVAGTSSHSCGVSVYGGKNLIPAQKFFSEGQIPFHSMLVGGEVVKSVPILVYECYLQSTHLHHDFLKIKIEDQLALALSLINPKYYDDFKKYCSQVASNNGVKMDVVDQKARKFKKRLHLPQFEKIINYLFRRRTILCNEFGVQDVYGAVLLAKAVYLLETKHAHWKLQHILSIFTSSRVKKLE